jgi:ArsR family transcriptional regulator
MQSSADILRVLGDETRLRILRILEQESLNVGELTQVLGLAQPTVSKHLSELRRVELLRWSRTAGFSYYELSDSPEGWWAAVASLIRTSGDSRNDLVRLGEVLKQRKEVVESTDRFVVPGRSWVAWSRALRYLARPQSVADFGCGDGLFTLELASWAKEVIAVDTNLALLETARQKATDYSNIRFLLGDMSDLPLRNGLVSLVVISQSLHYTDRPCRVIGEANRLLRPGGRVLVLDLLPHKQTWVQEELKHRWLGFPSGRLRDWLEKSGFSEIQLDTDTNQHPQPFRILIATGVKPSLESE